MTLFLTLGDSRESLAYLCGVLHGDGWCSRLTLGLRTKDQDFATAFAGALREACGSDALPRRDERGYWLLRTSNKTGKYDFIRDFQPSADEECRAWLRGLFDSEGNAYLGLVRGYSGSWRRRVAFYSTAPATFTQAEGYLTRLGMTAKTSPVTSSATHKGTRPVFELRLLCNRENFTRFARLVGSNINRKREVLAAIPRSYTEDLSASCRAAQLKGAATRRRNREQVTIPRVLAAIAELAAQGIKPTSQACRRIPGYPHLLKEIRHGDLVRMILPDYHR